MGVKTNRPPIVCILGHVDHGKTTLLDAIRKTNVTAGEAGGITQSIGGWLVETKDGEKITFIDTPGHAAFSKMRSHGAEVSDIAVLVVAADDGVQPQTKESLTYIKAADIPFIVALTKNDLLGVTPDLALSQLEKEGVLLEGRGGDVPWTSVSAKMGKGIEELLELISLVAEVGGITGDPGADLEAVVIETTTNRSGPIVSLIVQNGTIKTGQEISSDGKIAKVRGLFDDKGVNVTFALPGTPVAMIGFSTLPAVGSKVYQKGKEQALAEPPEARTGKNSVKLEKEQVGVFIKAKNAGSLEALLGNLPAGIIVRDSGVGDIFGSDILNARSSKVDYIFAFESEAPSAVSKLAESEGIKIFSSNIIYELFQKMEELVKAGQVEILGKAEVVASFPFNNKKIAGCKTTFGRIQKSDVLLLTREEKEIGRLRITSLKKQKQEVSEVRIGEEFGVLFEPQLDFLKGDVLVSVRK